jgi:hypothetical protein
MIPAAILSFATFESIGALSAIDALPPPDEFPWRVVLAMSLFFAAVALIWAFGVSIVFVGFVLLLLVLSPCVAYDALSQFLLIAMIFP